MQIYNAELEIDLLEFCDRFGNIRSTSGCSFKGKVEFDARIKILADLLKKYEGETIGAIYFKDKEFQHNCDRALKLNGINPNWLTEVHLSELLFLHNKNVGALVMLNRANNPSEKALGTRHEALGGGNLYHQFLGAMYNFSQDPEQAFRLAENYPFKEVAGMIQQVGKKSEIRNQKLERTAGEPERSPQRIRADRPPKGEAGTQSVRSSRKEISDRSRLELMALREKTKNR